jgi:hypothetical protein
MKNDLQMRFELTLKKIEIDLYQHQMDHQSLQALFDQELYMLNEFKNHPPLLTLSNRKLSGLRVYIEIKPLESSN